MNYLWVRPRSGWRLCLSCQWHGSRRLVWRHRWLRAATPGDVHISSSSLCLKWREQPMEKSSGSTGTICVNRRVQSLHRQAWICAEDGTCTRGVRWVYPKAVKVLSLITEQSRKEQWRRASGLGRCFTGGQLLQKSFSKWQAEPGGLAAQEICHWDEIPSPTYGFLHFLSMDICCSGTHACGPTSGYWVKQTSDVLQLVLHKRPGSCIHCVMIYPGESGTCYFSG